MVRLDPTYDPAILEEEARGFWKSRQLPAAGGLLGPREAPLVLQFEGTFTPGDPETLVAQRAVAADVEARYLGLAGRRSLGTFRFEPAKSGTTVPAAAPILARLGIWTGGDGTLAWDVAARHARVETLVGRLAHQGLLVARDLPLRTCPTCGEPRSPERIVYQEEDGEAHLVRFDVPLDGRIVHALVWVDAPWRLLGTSALLVQPDAAYVIALYRHGSTEELVLTSRSSLERFRDWMPRAHFDVLEEHDGRYFEGKPYEYPLRHEFPTGGTLDPPSGTILAVAEVSDTGTGIVPLVPGHGSTDAEIAEQRGVTGWPLVTPRGQLDLTLMHKYAGLDVPTGSEFILRDLAEGDAIFAQLKVRRGVPHCAVCGSTLLWIPGRAWCLEPSHLPPERLVDYARLLPGALPLDRIEVAPWPLSTATSRDDPEAVALLECSNCDRLESLDGPVACPCGGHRYPTRRRLITSAAGALAAWARPDPFPATAAVRLYVNERRRVPAIVHHLMASAAIEGGAGEIGATVLPSLPEVALGELADGNGADAVRAAYVRAAAIGRPTGTFAERCRTERAWLARFWAGVADVLAACDASLLAALAPPIGGFTGELETEDRALLARWERTRVLAIADYDRFDPASALRRVTHFHDTDLAQYRSWVAPRLVLPGAPPTRRAALRTLVHVHRDLALVLAPIVPHAAEAIVHRLSPSRASVFEGSLPGADRALLSDDLAAAWDRWTSVVVAASEFRRACRLPAEVVLPTAVLVVADDAVGDRLRGDRTVLERLARVGKVVVSSPREPWSGRQGKYVPVESEIQRLYPSQAAQIAHLLARSPPRGGKGPTGESELTVVVHGHPLRILPSMVEYVESLPTGYFARPWRLGELYLELPPSGTPPDRFPPPLSPDAFWLVRRVDRRLRRTPSANGGRVAVVGAADPLGGELRGQSEAIARYLGLSELRVVELADERPARRIEGRTRTGASWWVDVPGLGVLAARTKHRSSPPRCRRVPAGVPSAPRVEVDYAADELVTRWDSVRSLGSQLDDLLEAPLIGPTKVSQAWDRGMTSLDAYRGATYEQLVALPGFDAAIAARLIQKLGGSPPPARSAPPRAVTRRPPPPANAPPPAGPEAPDSTAEASLPEVSPGESPAGPASSTVPSDAGVAAVLTAETVAEVADHPPDSVPPGDGSPGAPPADVPTLSAGTGAAVAAAGAIAAEEVVAPPMDANEEAATAAPEIPDAPAVAETPEEPPRVEDTAPPEPGSTADAVAVGATAAVAGAAGMDELESPAPEPEGAESSSGDLESVTSMSSEPSAAAPKEAAAPEPGPVTEAVAVGATAAVAGAAVLEESESPEPAPVRGEPSNEDLGSGESTSPETPSPVVTEETPTGDANDAATGQVPEEATAAPVPDAGDAATTGSGGEPRPSTVGSEPGPSAGGHSGAAAFAAASVGAAAVGAAVIAGSERDAEEAEVTPEVLEPATDDAIAPAVEPVVAPPPPRPSGIELEVGSSPFTSIRPFLDATAAGHRGLCLVRDSPERVAAQVRPRPVDVYWLTNLGRGKTVRPSDLPGIFGLLDRAISEEHVTALFVEGIEYLVRIHGIEEIVGRLRALHGRAREHDARVWVHLTPDLLQPTDLRQLVGEFGSGPS